MAGGDADALEAVRWGAPPEGEAPPPEPPSFDERYVLPAHRTKLLQRLFPHERDRLHFLEKPHLYVIDGLCVDTSVSSLLKPYYKPFVADEIIRAMRNSRKEAWPRLAYAHGARQVWPPPGVAPPAPLAPSGFLLAVDEAGKTRFAGSRATLEMRAADGDEAAATAAQMLAACAADGAASPAAGWSLHEYERALTDDEIKHKWADVEKCNRGTEAHYMMELWMNSEPCRTLQPEVVVGLEFVRTQLAPHGIRAYRTEWEIYAGEEDVAGSIDFVGLHEESGEIVIVDWKRTPKLKANLHGFAWGNGRRDRLKPPLNHLDDCDGVKYTAQLSAYAWILEKYYGKRVRALALCSLHPDAPFHTWVPYLAVEMEYIMRCRREHVARRVVASHLATSSDSLGATLPRCAISGRLALDAVRDDTGRLCSEKELLASDPDALYTIELGPRAQCAKLLESICVEPPPSCVAPHSSSEARRLAESALPWENQMPKCGIHTMPPPRPL